MSGRRIGITVAWAALLGTLTVLGACRESGGGASSSASSADPGREGWPEVIRFGLVPSEGGTDIVERFGPMTMFLVEHLGHPVQAYSASEYIGVITAMQNRQVELAYYGPKSYIEAARVAGAEALVQELNEDGEPGYVGTIIVRKDSPYQSIQDTEGLTFAFVTPNSTSGYLVPAIGILRETGRTPEDFFGAIVYTGSHGSSMARVAAGDVPVAATNTLDMNAMARAGLVDPSVFRVIWRSEVIPGAPIAVRGDLPESLKTALREALLAFNLETAALEAMSRKGFIEVSDEAFDIVRVLEQRKAELTEAASDG